VGRRAPRADQLADRCQHDQDHDGTGDAGDACTAPDVSAEVCLGENFGASGGCEGETRLAPGARLAFELPPEPETGRYRVNIEHEDDDDDRATRLAMEVDGQPAPAIEFEDDDDDSQWVVLDLAAGAHRVEVVNTTPYAILLERTRLEAVCAEDQ
jgi:hypothetical protein